MGASVVVAADGDVVDSLATLGRITVVIRAEIGVVTDDRIALALSEVTHVRPGAGVVVIARGGIDLVTATQR